MYMFFFSYFCFVKEVSGGDFRTDTANSKHLYDRGF